MTYEVSNGRADVTPKGDVRQYGRLS